MKLLNNKEKSFCSKTEFKFTILLAKSDMVGLRLVLIGTNFSGDDTVDIQLVTFWLISNIKDLTIAKN